MQATRPSKKLIGQHHFHRWSRLLVFALLILCVVCPVRAAAQSCASCSKGTCGEKWEVIVMNGDGSISSVDIVGAWSAFGLFSAFEYPAGPQEEIDRVFPSLAGQYTIKLGGWGVDDMGNSRATDTALIIRRRGADGVQTEWSFTTTRDIDHPESFLWDLGGEKAPSHENSIPGAGSDPEMWPPPESTPSTDGTSPDAQSAPTAGGFTQTFGMGRDGDGNAGYVTVSVDLVGGAVDAQYVTFNLDGADATPPRGAGPLQSVTMGGVSCTITNTPPNCELSFTENGQVVATTHYTFSGTDGNQQVLVDSVVGTQETHGSVETTTRPFMVEGANTNVVLGTMIRTFGDSKTVIDYDEGVFDEPNLRVGRLVKERSYKKIGGDWALVAEETRREMGSALASGLLTGVDFKIKSRSVRAAPAGAGPNAEWVTTNYEYHSVTNASGTLGGGAQNGHLKSEGSSDGTWKKYEYADAGKKVFTGSPWLDASGVTTLDNASSANCCVTYDAKPSSGIDQTERITNVQTRKRQTVYASTSSVPSPPLPAGAGTLHGLATLEKDAAGNTLTTTRRFDRKVFDDPADSSRKFTVGLDQSADGVFHGSEEVKAPAVGNVAASTTTTITTGAMSGTTPKYLNQSASIEVIDDGVKTVTETHQVWGTQTGAWAPAGWVEHLYDGDHISQSKADRNGDQSGKNSQSGPDEGVIYKSAPAVVAANGDKTVTETDAHGITRVTVFNAEDELLSETKSGMVGGTNPGVAASVMTTHTRTPTVVADVRTGITETVTVTAGGAARTESVTETDFQGRVVRTVDAVGRETLYAYTDGGRTVTETLPGGLTRVTKRYLDGQLKSITGTAVVPEFHEYQVNTDGTITETVSLGGTGTGPTANWRKTTRNALGWTLREEEPSPLAGTDKVTTHTYNSKGQRVSTHTAGLAALRYEYDVFGRLTRQQRSEVNEDGSLGATMDPTTETVVEYLSSGGVWHEVTKQRRFVSAGAPEETQHWRKLTEGPLTFEKVVNPDGSRTQTAVSVDRGNKRVTETRSAFRQSTGGVGAVTTRTFSNGLLVGETLADVSLPVGYVHNGFGQMTGMSHPQAGAIGWGYDALGQRGSEVSAAQGTVAFAFYPSDHASAGQIKSVTRTTVDATTTVVTRQAYNALGQMTHQWGSAAQPIQYLYDQLGRMNEMRTYRDGTGWNTEPVPPDFSTASFSSTKWDYHPGTDALWKKTDAANRAVEYVYDAAGLLTARKWARTVAGGERLTTSYSYQQTPGGLAVPGRVTGISYNDGITPAVSMTYGRAYLSQVTDAAGQRFIGGTQYLGGGTENYVGAGLLKGLLVARTVKLNGGYRSVNAMIGPQAIVGQSQLVMAELGEAGVSGQHAGGGAGETYSYQRNAESGRLEFLQGNIGGRFTLIRRLGYDPFGRLDWVYNGGMGVKYEHRADGKRSAMWQWKPTDAGAVEEKWPGWSFHYNDRGEVDGTSRFVPANLSDGSYNAPVVASQTRGYAYDNMGNRLAAGQGPVNPTHTTSYTPDALNQYNAITNVRHAEVRGQAVAGAAVTVRINGGAAVTVDRTLAEHQTGDPNSFRYEAAVSGADASWLDVEITATKNGLSQNKRGFVYVPPASEALTYDEDGNLTSDGRWLYFWDAENRMIGAEEKPRPVGGVGDPALPPRKRLTFAYDYRHRRIQKKVEEESNAGLQPVTWVVKKDLRFVYDDWNLIAELDHTTASGTSLYGSTVVRSYVWGLDLAGQNGADFQSAANPWQGAGGVGGLLSVKHQGVTYHPCYDGNGNIIGLQAADGPQAGQIVARYDYDPFGNRITDTGPGVELCPFGFSTKYRDEETGMLYYGRRCLRTSDGRWVSRDPIGERGGINLYGMVGNDPVNRTDYLGLHNQVATPFYVLSRNVHYDPATDGLGVWFAGNVLGINHAELNADSANEAGIPVISRSTNLSKYKDVKFYDVFIELNPSRKLDDGSPCECAHIGSVSECLKRNGSGCSGGNCQQDVTTQLERCCLISKWYIDPYAYRPPPEAFDTGGIPLGR